MRPFHLMLLAVLALAPPATAGMQASPAARLADRLAAAAEIPRIAVLHPRTAAGRAQRDALMRALRSRGLGVVAVASHAGRLAPALGHLGPAAPDIVVSIGDPGTARAVLRGMGDRPGLTVTRLSMRPRPR